MHKKHKAALAYVLALMVFTTYVFMDTFVITRVYGDAADQTAGNSQNSQTELQADEEGSADQADDTADDSEAGNMGSPAAGRAATVAREAVQDTDRAAEAARARANTVVLRTVQTQLPHPAAAHHPIQHPAALRPQPSRLPAR